MKSSPGVDGRWFKQPAISGRVKFYETSEGTREDGREWDNERKEETKGRIRQTRRVVKGEIGLLPTAVWTRASITEPLVKRAPSLNLRAR